MKTGLMVHQDGLQVSQALPLGQLCEYHNAELIPTGKDFDVLVSLVFLDDSVKFILGHVAQELTEDITTVIHLLSFCYLTQNSSKLLFSKPPRCIFDRQFKQYQ